MDDLPTNLFQDPTDFYPPTPPPTTETYTTASGAAIALRLVGYSPTEAHHLWNGARVLAAHLEANPGLVRGRSVLELGAGAALPSIVAAVLGARAVVATDFPDPDLVENMWRNVRGCELIPRRRAAGMKKEKKMKKKMEEEESKKAEGDGKGEGKAGKEGGGDEEVVGNGQVVGKDEDDDTDDELPIVTDGYVWGADPSKLLGYLDDDDEEDNEAEGKGDAKAAGQKKPKGFDVLILADLLFRHSEHGNMLRTVRQTLKRSRESKAFVVFTSYRPWLQHKDLAFFDLAREEGFVVEKVLEKKMDRPLFENDPGDEEVRKTVTGWVLRWPDEMCQDIGS